MERIRSWLGPSATVTLFTFVGLVVGFGSQLVLAALFGARADMDAYLAAVTLPQFVIAVLVNSLNYVFIPIFVEYRRRGDLEGAWRVASSLLTLGLLTLGGLAILGVVFAASLQRALVPGFAPATLALTVRMARLTWPTVLTFGLGTLLGGLYQSHERFGRAAAAPVVGALVALGGTLLLAPTWGIVGVAAAGLAGSAVQLLLLVPLVIREPQCRLMLGRSDGVVRVLRLLVPLVIGTLFSRAAILVDRFVASRLAEGSLAHLGYANKLVSVMASVLAAGLSVTALVSMSEHAASDDAVGLRGTVAARLRLMWFLVAPVVTILTALRVDFVGTLFERGHFVVGDTAAVAAALPWYLLSLIAMVLGSIVGNAYYALQDTRTPAIIAVIEVLAYVVYMPWLATRLGYLGVAIGFAVYWDVSIVIIGTVLWIRTGRHHDGAFVRSGAVTAAAAMVGGAAALAVRSAVRGPHLLDLALGLIAGCAVYALVLALLRSEELTGFLAGAKGRLLALPLAGEPTP